MMSLCVPDPEITELLDLRSGRHLPVRDVISSKKDEVSHLRLAIRHGQQEGAPLYACALCNVPVSLLQHPQSGLFFFRHLVEDGRCSAVTRGQLSRDEIDARKYNGVKESACHIRMKELVAGSLLSDSRFSEVEVERRWTDKLTGDWRQPDVQATYGGHEGCGGLQVAFEIQLSTTYLDVIAARRRFYLAKGGLLFWIFAEFKDSDRRLMQDDVFFNNNQNAFLVSEETTAASVALREFQLNCVWAEPTSSNTVSALQRKSVSFHDLTLDTETQRAFYFDFYGEKAVLQQKELAATAPLRDSFEAAWIAWASDEADIGKVWGKFCREFRAKGVSLPFAPYNLHQILLNALYSAKHGRVIGWRYSRFIEVAHRIAIGHKGYLQLFRHALKVYGRGDQLVREDKSSKWKTRVAQYKEAIRRKDPAYTPVTAHYEVLAFLFPELFTEPVGFVPNSSWCLGAETLRLSSVPTG